MYTDTLYAVRNKQTGKLVSNLTSKHKKYWESRAACAQAIQNSFRHYDERSTLEIVQFKLIEVTDENFMKLLSLS